MKISILTPDLSHNCVGRAYLLTKVLQRHYEVEIIGPAFGSGIWKPIADDKSIRYRYIRVSGKLRPYWQLRDIIKSISGNVIYASKPLVASYGIGLLEKFLNGKPIVLDIDDWEIGFIKAYRKLSFRYLVSSIVCLYSRSSYWNNLLGERFSYFASDITVSNSFLRKKFGGTIVWHGRNTDVFNPMKFDKNIIREKYEIEKDKKVIIFVGTPRPHKGIDDLIEAMTLVKEPSVILVVVGIDYSDPYCLDVIHTAEKKLDKNRFIAFGLQPFRKIPEFLAMADVVVIPQKKNFATVGQVPAKVFDAMAMEKAIISTNVSDIPEILYRCGWIVEPERPKELAQAIQYILDNPRKAQEMSRKARERCIEKYSWEAIEKILVKVFGKYE
ncbi:MAG: glycosyltransferase family 4 protein [Deltaproteobacteria bacterium]|nr:glycosyltransferase family 4 protein [Deltaproteobacteria bacterium]MBW2126120.1 glycosyltransferase family 4 protein [Deltaproteobacteria bacterium]